MKKYLILLPLLSLHLSLHAQSKWSAGYRLGLVYEDAFSNNSNSAVDISNQGFVSYRALKWLELEAGIQHNRSYYSTGVTDEMFRVMPDYSFSNFTAQVFSFSLNARFYFFNKGAFSVYALTGASSCMVYGHYETKAGNQAGELLKSTHNIPNQFKPLATVFAGFGVNYQICRRIKLNAQVAAYASKIELKVDSDFPFLYNPDLSTQIGFSYAL